MYCSYTERNKFSNVFTKQSVIQTYLLSGKFFFLLCKCTILGTRNINTKTEVESLFIEQKFIGTVPKASTKNVS